MNHKKKKTILLVEDEALIAMFELKKLQEKGYTVIHVGSGEKAVETVRDNKNSIDLILMDIDLGNGIDGTEAAAIILKERDIPVVFLSAHTEPEIVDKTEKITSYGYVVKNTGITVLDASIKMAFRLFEEKQNVRLHQEKLAASNEELEASYEEMERNNEELEESQREILKREEAIQKSEETHRALIENLSDMILILDKDGVNIWNSPAVRQYGMEPEDAIGINARDYTHPDDKGRADRVLKDVVKNPGKKYLEKALKVVSDSGEIIYFDDTFVYLPDTPGIHGIIVCCRNVTEQKLYEEKITNLLHEKEILLKEIHHRVKNNMNVIKNLLVMQSQSLGIPEIVTAFQDAIGRIDSMEELYDKLYKTGNYQYVSVKEYISQLLDEIYQIFPNKQEIKIEKRIDDFAIDANILFPLGIIINEMLSNAIKHAFKERKEGLIQVSLERKDNHVRILFEDNGVGIPETERNEQKKGFGLMLIHLLTEQIGGNYKIERDNGTRYIIEFDV